MIRLRKYRDLLELLGECDRTQDEQDRTCLVMTDELVDCLVGSQQELVRVDAVLNIG